jgi:hypothetical protein
VRLPETSEVRFSVHMRVTMAVDVSLREAMLLVEKCTVPYKAISRGRGGDMCRVLCAQTHQEAAAS